MKSILTTTLIFALSIASTNSYCKVTTTTDWRGITTSYDSETGIKTIYGSDCSGKCTWVYNDKDQSFVVTLNEGANGDIILGKNYVYGDIGKIKTISIPEGITGLSPYTFNDMSAEEGTTLKLPSTITSFGWAALSGLPFETVDISEVKVDVTLSGNQLETVILGENNTHLLFDFGYNPPHPDIKILCKSTDLNTCSSKISKGMWCGDLKVDTDFYKGYDEHGNLIEEWDENGKKAYSYKYFQNGDYSKYDENGNFLGNFMSDGSKRRIYMIDEAVAVVKDNKNTFSIIYR